MKLNFDWQDAEHDSFVKYVITTLIADKTKEEFDELSNLTNKWTDIELSIFINGIEVNAQAFLDGVDRNMHYYAKDYAKDLVHEKLNIEAIDQLNDVIKATKKRIIEDFGLQDWEYE